MSICLESKGEFANKLAFHSVVVTTNVFLKNFFFNFFSISSGLSEVLFALGQERLDKLMPDVITTTMKTELSPNIRDGYLMLYIYLPSTFGEDFTEYIGPIIPPILKVSSYVCLFGLNINVDHLVSYWYFPIRKLPCNIILNVIWNFRQRNNL